MSILKTSPKNIALHDIAEWMKQQNIQIKDKVGDVWVISAWKIDCKEQRKLNKELGVSKVNYSGNKEGLKRLHEQKRTEK